ncbi:MAG TPA: hypothetical protein VGL39_27595 [Jatrophihabitantaceae bacterium]|jgi:hypothetical protein
MGLASLLRHVGIHTPNGVTVDGIPVEAEEFIETAAILAEPYNEEITQLRDSLQRELALRAAAVEARAKHHCRHVGWLTGRAAALRLDADRADRDSIAAETATAQGVLSERARVYRLCALELDNLAAELGAA